MRRQLYRAGPNETPQVPSIKNSTCKMKLAQLDAVLTGCGGRIAICYRGLLSLVFRAAGWVSLVIQYFEALLALASKLLSQAPRPASSRTASGMHTGRNFARAGSHEGLALIYTAILYGHDTSTPKTPRCVTTKDDLQPK
jgi:hypothetical protein